MRLHANSPPVKEMEPELSMMKVMSSLGHVGALWEVEESAWSAKGVKQSFANAYLKRGPVWKLTLPHIVLRCHNSDPEQIKWTNTAITFLCCEMSTLFYSRTRAAHGADNAVGRAGEGRELCTWAEPVQPLLRTWNSAIQFCVSVEHVKTCNGCLRTGWHLLQFCPPGCVLVSPVEAGRRWGAGWRARETLWSRRWWSSLRRGRCSEPSATSRLHQHVSQLWNSEARFLPYTCSVNLSSTHLPMPIQQVRGATRTDLRPRRSSRPSAGRWRWGRRVCRPPCWTLPASHSRAPPQCPSRVGWKTVIGCKRKLSFSVNVKISQYCVVKRSWVSGLTPSFGQSETFSFERRNTLFSNFSFH